MSGAAIYDALQSSPELISLNMTGVLIVYSALFSRWALVVKPQNLLLAGCHVTNVAAQSNQLRRAIEDKRGKGADDEVRDVLMKAAGIAAAGAACVAGGPALQGAIVGANLGPISALAAAEAGPLYVLFFGRERRAPRCFPCRFFSFPGGGGRGGNSSSEFAAPPPPSSSSSSW